MVWLGLTSCVLFAKEKAFDVDLGLLDEADVATSDPVGELGFGITLYDERPSWYLPAFLDTEDWGALLLADRVLRQAGEVPLVTAEVSELLWEEPETLVLSFVPSSAGDGRLFSLGDEPGALPEACTVEVTTETLPQDHAADVLKCLTTWIDVNGGPLSLFVDVTAATDAEDWSFAATYAFSTQTPAVVTCTAEQVVGDELRDEAGSIDVERLEVAGYVGVADSPASLVVWENTWDDANADATAGGWSWTWVGAGQGAFIGTTLSVPPTVPGTIVFGGEPAPVTTFPDTWRETSIASLEAPAGFVQACAVMVHDVLPNHTWLHFALVGDGIYTGGE